MTLETLRTEARNFAGVNAKTVTQPPTEHDKESSCLQSAIEEYSRKKPLLSTLDIVTNGASRYLLEGWSDVNTARLVRLYVNGKFWVVDDRDWRVRQSEGAWYLFLADVLQGEIQLEYYGVHVVSDAINTTVPDAHKEPLAHLAAYYILLAAANKMAENANSTIGADSVSQNEQSKAYSFQSKDAFATWERFLNGSKTNRSTRVNWDLSRTEHNGMGRFWNRRGRIGL
jgi:hypothetical protein